MFSWRKETWNSRKFFFRISKILKFREKFLKTYRKLLGFQKIPEWKFKVKSHSETIKWIKHRLNESDKPGNGEFCVKREKKRECEPKMRLNGAVRCAVCHQTGVVCTQMALEQISTIFGSKTTRVYTWACIRIWKNRMDLEGQISKERVSNRSNLRRK